MKIETIVFDLGGVLINLDFTKTAKAFEALGVKNFDDYFTQFHAHPLFKQLEVGEVIGNEFYDELRRTAEIDASNEEIDKAWNAMLLDFPKNRIEKLAQLKKDYRLFLFSNTNAIHHAAFHAIFRNEFGYHFDELFEKAWYSHLVAQRKPDQQAFEYIIRDAALNAGATLFLDDTFPNIDAAKRAGLQAALVTRENDVVSLLDQLL